MADSNLAAFSLNKRIFTMIDTRTAPYAAFVLRLP